MLALLVACVTINVYFPAAAAQEAADRIINKVYGSEGEGGETAPAPKPESRRNRNRLHNRNHNVKALWLSPWRVRSIG